jgi:hypothetical protein
LKQNKKIYDENPFMINFAFLCNIGSCNLEPGGVGEDTQVGGLMIGWLNALISIVGRN